MSVNSGEGHRKIAGGGKLEALAASMERFPSLIGRSRADVAPSVLVPIMKFPSLIGRSRARFPLASLTDRSEFPSLIGRSRA